MDELRLRRIFLGLIRCSLLVGAGGCGGRSDDDTAAREDELANDRVGGGGSAGNEAGNGGSGGGSTGGTAGMGGTSGTGGAEHQPSPEPFWADLPLDEFSAPSCESGRWRATLGLNPASPADFIALRRTNGATVTEIDSNGTACASAADGVTCAQALGASAEGIEMSQSCGGPPHPCQHFLVSTAGNEVETWVSRPELLQFLGPIDTPAEALLASFQGTFMGYQVACDEPDGTSARAVSDGYEVVLTRMVRDCAPIVVERALLHVATDGTVTPLRSNVASVSQACVGRRLEGLAPPAPSASSALGEFFAGIAFLEAASVEAFLRLARELEALGAPEELACWALEAAQDEVRHALETRRLAERFGGQVSEPRVEAIPLRDLERVAAENAAEGCVRETFGALVAHHQAENADDPAIAAAMRAIAADETRHAALAWRVASWAERRLSDSAKRRVRGARHRALVKLPRELEAPVPVELRRRAGIPAAEVALELFDGLARELWNTSVPSASAARTS